MALAVFFKTLRVGYFRPVIQIFDCLINSFSLLLITTLILRRQRMHRPSEYTRKEL